jgi:hypothetical protein
MTRLPQARASAFIALLALAFAAPAAAEAPSKAVEGAKTDSFRLPSNPEELVAYVKQAVASHDLEAFDRLVEWRGATPLRRRMTLHQIRYTFGRPIRTATVEAFPDDGLEEAKNVLALQPNLPVTDRLRIVFDEGATPSGDDPASVLLLGKEDGVYRISLLLGSRAPRK